MSSPSQQPTSTATSLYLEGGARPLVAPMVRVSHLGFRVLCAEQGAGPLFSEEIIAGKLARCVRRVDKDRGVVEFIEQQPRGPEEKGMVRERLVFATKLKTPENPRPEGAPVILQLGAYEPISAVRAAKLVEQDVDGIDLNMGCPRVVCEKKYDQGYGAALMGKPDVACDILRALVRECSLPISAKTRLMDTDEEALELVRRLAATGVHAITLHSRTRLQKTRVPAVHDRTRRLREALGPMPCAMFLNGDFFSHREGEETARACGFDGYMAGRGAMDNPSMFQPDGPKWAPVEAMQHCVRYHFKYGTPIGAVRYHVTRSLQKLEGDVAVQKMAKSLYRARGVKQFCEFVGIPSEEADAIATAYVPHERMVCRPEGFVWPDTWSNINDRWDSDDDTNEDGEDDGATLFGAFCDF
eukprot:PhM_4_TR1208/c0_g2_i1/m.30206/K05543/DUS2; tRNA-dihydrouridine synthase 2